MSELKITGNPNPVVGKEELYSVNQLLPSILPFPNLSNDATNPFEQPVEWSVHVLERGRWIPKEENNKTGTKVSYKFMQKSLERRGIRIVANRGGRTARLEVKPHKAESPKIDKIEFLDKNGNKPSAPFAYGQTLKARIHCLHMEHRTIYATLWEDDAAGAGHDKANEKNKMKTLPGTVKDGIADIDFVLEPDFAKIANALKAKGDTDEGKTHEYYVTAEIFHKKTASKNTNVTNPADKVAMVKPTTTKKQTPAQKKGPSKKQEKEKSILDDVIDWWEAKVKIEPIIAPNPIDFINSLAKIFTPDGKEDEKKEEEKSIEGCGIKYRNSIRCNVYNGKHGPIYFGDLKMSNYKQWDVLISTNKITQEEKEIIIAMSSNEGNLDSVQSYDSEIVTVGAMQKTINPYGFGEFPQQMAEFKKDHPDKFKKLFENCGWSVKEEINSQNQNKLEWRAFYKDNTGSELKLKIRAGFDTVISGQKAICIPIEPLINASKDSNFQAKQIEDFIKRLHVWLNEMPDSYNHKIGDFVKSKLGKATVLDHSVNRPGHVKSCFAEALDLFFSQNNSVSINPNNWEENHLQYESEILDIYGPLRKHGNKYTMTDAAGRYNNLKLKF